MFTGDTLYDGPLFDTITGADIADLCGSLRRLRDLPVRRVLGGHREPFGRARMIEVIDRYLAERVPTRGADLHREPFGRRLIP